MHQSLRLPVISTVSAMRAALMPLRAAGKRIGLVPTMGALHEGHLSLVRASHAQCDATVVWIYVNPSQFGPQEDLAKYPRTLDADLDRLASCQIAPGALWVFAPTDSEVYKPGHGTWVEPQGVALPLEGRLRPGHFRGVATVVLKMFNMVQPHKAFFGRKDFQQLRVIEQMAEDLDLSVEIVGCPIVREADGLALSSRNIYLNTVARAQARVLSQALELARQLVAGGERKAAAIAAAMVTLLEAAGNADAGPVKIDYVALVDPRTLEDVHTVSGPTLAALAVRVGSTRLIDNCLLEA